MLEEKSKTRGQKPRTPKVIINNERRLGNGKPGSAKDKNQSGSLALSSPLIGGLPGSSLLIGQQAASLQLAQLQAQLALTQINSPLTVSSRANSSSAAPSPTASAISLLNLLKIANNMYNPYGNQRQNQGQYGANTNPDSRIGTSNMGAPFNPLGARGSENPLSGVPMYAQPIPYRPETSRTEVDRNLDLQRSRTREEARLLNAPLSQSSTHPPSQMKPQRDEVYSPFSAYSAPPSSNYSAPSSSTYSNPPSSTYSAPQQPSRASDIDSSVGGSLSWLLNLSKSSSAEPRSFASSSSSSNFQGTGDSQRNRNESAIPGLGDYPDRKTPPPPQRKDSAPAKYSAETAASILRHFNLEKEDLEQLISYPENEITPDSLPLILRQIRIEKNRKSAATPSSYKDSRVVVSTLQEPKQNTLMDYVKKDSATDYNMDRSLPSTTSRDYVKDIPPIPNKSDLEKEKSTVLQPSKVIDYRHTGKYMGGAGGSDNMGTIARAIQGIMKIDTGFIREPLQSTPTASSSMTTKPISSLVTPSQDKVTPAATFSSLFSSTFTSASSDLPKKPQVTQPPTMSKSFSIPKQDTDFRLRKPDAFTEKADNIKPLSKLSPSKTIKKTGVVLVDSIKKQKVEAKKQEVMTGHQGKAGQSASVGIQPTFAPRKVLTPFPPKASPIPTLSSNATGRPTVVPAGISTVIPTAKQMPNVASNVKGNFLPVTQQTMPQAKSLMQLHPKPEIKPAPAAPPKASTAVKGLPTSAMMQDYAAASPRFFPHTCSLCHKECAHMKDWISHQNSTLHIEKCKFLHLIYPEWDGEVTLRDPLSSSAQSTSVLNQPSKTRRSRSRSPSPRRRDRRRSRTRSPQRLTHRSRSVSPHDSSRRAHSRSRSRERREQSPRRGEERRRRTSPKRTSPKRSEERRNEDRRVSPRYSNSEERRVSTRYNEDRRNDDRRNSPKRTEERTRSKNSPQRSRHSPPSRYSRYSPSRYSPNRYSPLRGFDRYTPPRGYEWDSLSSWRDRDEQSSQSRSSRETRSSSLKRTTKKSAAQRRKQNELEQVTKQVLESSSTLKSLSSTTDLPALAQMLVPVIMSQMKQMNPSAAPSTGTKKKMVRKPTTTTVKKTISTAAKPTAVKPSTMVRLGSIIPPLSHDDVVAFAEKFGKTKSVLLFRQKHQAVVCFENEEDAKKLRNAKEIQIKEHPVSIVRYKEAVSTTQRKSPVSAVKKPVKSVIKPSATGKTAPKSVAPKPGTSKAPVLKSTTVKKPLDTSKQVPKQDKIPQESNTTTTATTATTTLTATATATPTIAEVVVTTGRKFATAPRTMQRSSLKEVQIQHDVKMDAKRELIEIKPVDFNVIEVSSGTDCEDEETLNEMEAETKQTDISTEKAVGEQIEVQPAMGGKTSNEGIAESAQNTEQSFESNDSKISEPSVSMNEKDLGKEKTNQESLEKENVQGETTLLQEKQENVTQQNASILKVSDVEMEEAETVLIQEEKVAQEKADGVDDSVKEVTETVEQPREDSTEQNAEKSTEKQAEEPLSNTEEEQMEVLTTDGEKTPSETPKREDTVTKPSSRRKPAEPTWGEDLHRLVTVNSFQYLKQSTVLSKHFLHRVQSNCVVILSNLPEFNPEDPYSEKDVITLVVTCLKGFEHEFSTKPNSYVLPQCRMAFIALPNKNAAQALVRRFVNHPQTSMFRNCQLSAHVIYSVFNMSPMAFYVNLMPVNKKNMIADKAERTIFITNIPHSDMAEVRRIVDKIGYIQNYLPLLHKVFVEFETVQAADTFGIYHSLLKRAPAYEMFRMMPPANKGIVLSRHMATKGMPEPSERVAGVVLPASTSGIPAGSQSPFWVTMTTAPYFYPTQSLWFLCPKDYEELNITKSRKGRTVMLTGLPVAGYTHEDVATLAWRHLLGKHLHCLYYNVIVLPFQRRAFIDFSSVEKCAEFVDDYFKQTMTVQGAQVCAHHVKDRLFPVADEEQMYRTFMKLSNARVPVSHLLEQRLLCVFVTRVTFEVVRLVIEVVTSAAPILGYLPLANRICIELADSDDVAKVKEKFSSYVPEFSKEQMWYVHLKAADFSGKGVYLSEY